MLTQDEFQAMRARNGMPPLADNATRKDTDPMADTTDQAAEQQRRAAIEAALKGAGIRTPGGVKALAGILEREGRIDVDDAGAVRMVDDYRDLGAAVRSWLRTPEIQTLVIRDREIAAEHEQAAATQTAEEAKLALGRMVAGMPTQRIESKAALEAAVASAFGVKPDPQPSAEPTLRERIGRGLVEAL
jgi:hypothetical protein